MSRSRSGAVLRACMLFAAIMVPGCQSGDRIPPDGSTINLSASPASIVLDANGIQAAPVTLLATVRTSVGVPLPGQDVRFTTSSGALTPLAGTPVRTDDFGNARSILQGATVGPQITATAGKATQSLTLTAAKGQISTITLSPGLNQLLTCNDTFDLTATVLDSAGIGVQGVSVQFAFTSSANTAVTGTFNPSPGQTDASGQITTTLTIDSNTCNNRCVGNGKDCSTFVQAMTIGGTVVSNSAQILDQI